MRVIWPEELDAAQEAAAESAIPNGAFQRGSDCDTEPGILKFPAASERVSENELEDGIRPEDQSPADRAKLIHHNSFCRSCQRALISLILAEDGRRDGTGDFVPGTQTLIGFRCECCHSEWPARPKLALV